MTQKRMRLTNTTEWTFLDIGRMTTTTRSWHSFIGTSQYTPEDDCGPHWHEVLFVLVSGKIDDLDVERALLFKCYMLIIRKWSID